MDGKEEVLVRRRANHIRDSPELEREEGRRAEVPCAGNLERYNTGNDVLGERLVAAELGDLRVAC